MRGGLQGVASAPEQREGFLRQEREGMIAAESYSCFHGGATPWQWLRDLFPWVVWNTGGPRSRTRTTWVASSVLAGHLPVQWSRELTVGIPGKENLDLVARAYHTLENLGYRDPDEAAQALPLIPRHRLHCRRVKIGSRRHSGKGPRAAERFLFEALVLGRCSETFYDPCKPVIWTNNRLNRGLALYTPDRFLDED